MILYTTLKDLRSEKACIPGYNKLVRHLQGASFTPRDEKRESYIRFAHSEQIDLLAILESNGLNDALWSLRAVRDSATRDKIARLFSCDCAVSALSAARSEDVNLLRDCISVARRFAHGEATAKELEKAHASAASASAYASAASASAYASAASAYASATHVSASAYAHAASAASAHAHAYAHAHAAYAAYAYASAYAAYAAYTAYATHVSAATSAQTENLKRYLRGEKRNAPSAVTAGLSESPRGTRRP